MNSVKIIKCDIIMYFLTLYIITSIPHFLQNWKRLILVHKKKIKFNIQNYNQASILPVLSKIYERCIFDQMYSYSNQILTKHQCGFEKCHKTQHSLLLIVEKLKKSLDNSVVGGMVLTDLSKVFVCLRRDLLIVKLATYGFD